MDLRPILEGDKYPMYVDGVGWTDECPRNAGYCPICNPKNYTSWIQKLEIEAQKKKELKLIEEEQQLKAQAAFLDDQKRVIALLEQVTVPNDNESTIRSSSVDMTRFEYTNGDIYEGTFLSGMKSGFGIMSYADGSIYEGNWWHDLRHGVGKMNWGDGITYNGAWANDKMNGQGRYVMADGTVLEGMFVDDEIAES